MSSRWATCIPSKDPTAILRILLTYSATLLYLPHRKSAIISERFSAGQKPRNDALRSERKRKKEPPMKTILLLCFPLLLFGSGETLVPQKRSDLSITIYNDDLAFIHDRREANVSRGRQRLIYEGVAGSLVTPSVVPGFSGVPVRL
jgi:hypothetical protein